MARAHHGVHAAVAHDDELDTMVRWASPMAIVCFGGEVDCANDDDKHGFYQDLGSDG